MLVNAVEPVLYIREGLSVSHVEGDDHTVGLLVEGVGDRAETFLTRRVPNLHCDVLTLGVLVSC
jgi:hypothetical protein